MNKKELILKKLQLMFPNAKTELNYTNNFELLIAVVLSAQTTDKAVNGVTKTLFSKYPTVEVLAVANADEVEQIINKIGLYRNKTKNIISLSKTIVEKHRGKVPSNRKDLESLAGVGRKTANVVLSNAFNVPTIAVDTHVERVSKRLGLAQKDDSVWQVEQKLMDFFPEKDWRKLHHQMILFGRYQCTSRKPKCQTCPLFDLCDYELKKQE